jgi:tRNA A37 threonylcarbamoyladenosine dehydratase
MQTAFKEQFSRTSLLIGDENLNKLQNAKIAVFGVGGVGSFTVEALARAGIGSLLLVDNDTVSESNINRQLPALHSTVGKLKVEVMAERIKDINPSCQITVKAVFYNKDTVDEFCSILEQYQYIVDAIDTVSSKLLLIETAHRLGIPIISAMGAGNKLNPCSFEVSDIYKTSVCPLARVMRHELKKRHIPKLKVVYSKEEPKKIEADFPSSISFVPSVSGLIIASEVIKDLIK